MKGHKGVIIGIVILVAVCTLVFWLIFGIKSDRFKWYETYEADEDQPYDLSVIRDMLKKKNPGAKFAEIRSNMGKELPGLPQDDSASYVLIGGSLYLDSAATEALLSFVEKGNTAFIAARDIPMEFMYRIYDFSCNPTWDRYRYYGDTTVMMNFTHPVLKEEDHKFTFFRRHEPDWYYWNYLDDSYLCSDSASQFIPLGFFFDPDTAGQKSRYDSVRVNFFMVHYGQGTFLFHTNPVAFSNYFMIRRSGYDYAGKVFAHLGKGNIYWDERSKMYYFPKQNGGEDTGGGNADMSDSPLRYLLTQTSLRWALYTLLVLVIFFSLLRARRRQKPIPLLEPNTNSSLDFVTSVGRLYYMQRNHKALCQQMMRQFLAFVRNRYGLATNVLNEELQRKLTEKSGVRAEVLEKIFKQFNWIDHTVIGLSDAELIVFYQTVDQFYKTCK